MEGAAAQNPLMQRGYSRDHRPDCKQVVIALIVNEEGFPLSYEVFDGDRAEVTTLEAVLRTVERKYGRDRKSTRLNSSHLVISYAVFCLKKKKTRVATMTKLLYPFCEMCRTN